MLNINIVFFGLIFDVNASAFATKSPLLIPAKISPTVIGFQLSFLKMASKKKTKTRVKEVGLDITTISELGGDKVIIMH